MLLLLWNVCYGYLLNDFSVITIFFTSSLMLVCNCYFQSLIWIANNSFTLVSTWPRTCLTAAGTTMWAEE